MLRYRFGEVSVYVSIIMTLILVTYISLYVHSIRSLSQQNNYLVETQQIESIKRAENLFFRYAAEENAIYATSTISTSIKSLMIYDSTSVVYNSLVNIRIYPSSWVKVIDGDLAKRVTEGNYVLGVITENGNLVTWVPQQETLDELSITLLPAVRYQSFVSGYPKYVGLVTAASSNEFVCDVNLNTECVGALSVSFLNERKVIINAPASYADLIGVYAWVKKHSNITLKIIFAENNFNALVNVTLYYLLLPPNSRVEDLVTYRCHTNYTKPITQPLKKTIVKNYVRKSVIVDTVSLSINESITRAGVLTLLAFTVSLPSGQYPQNPTVLLDIEVIEVR